ncbi:hypothetical protein JL720_10267 [Aureococcus anophagefferens]|nr:hypothetical protein JL720_10267 [Aureococcus anophagefferens]
MSETSTKRNFGPAWRKDGGTFGAPVKAPSPVENGHGDGGAAGSEASGPKAPPVRKAPGVTFTKSQLLGLRQPTVLLESMRAALPREITSAEPLAPCSSGRRPTTEQIGAAWQAARPRKEEGSDAPKDKGPRAPRDPPPGGKDRDRTWERGMSVPQRNLGGDKLWDEPDLDDETFGDGAGASALSSWAEAAQAFEAEMRAMREKGGGQLPGGDLGTPDMFGAAFSGDADGADIDKAAREERARAAKALESLEAAASAPPPAPGLAAPARKDDDDGSWRVKPWFYKDPQGQHQGPFEAPQMRQWFNAGYFDDDLPLRQGESGDFVPLGRLFSSPQDATGPRPRRGARGAAGRGKSAFGGPVATSNPDALQTWCKTQLKKINGSDDITLIQFCMTLTDNSEIRQYLSMYLGSTPQVAAFANEFIKRKQGKVPAAAAAAPAPAPKQQAAHSDAPQAQGASSKSRRRGRRAKAGA